MDRKGVAFSVHYFYNEQKKIWGYFHNDNFFLSIIFVIADFENNEQISQKSPKLSNFLIFHEFYDYYTLYHMV